MSMAAASTSSSMWRTASPCSATRAVSRENMLPSSCRVLCMARTESSRSRRDRGVHICCCASGGGWPPSRESRSMATSPACALGAARAPAARRAAAGLRCRLEAVPRGMDGGWATEAKRAARFSRSVREASRAARAPRKASPQAWMSARSRAARASRCCAPCREGARDAATASARAAARPKSLVTATESCSISGPGSLNRLVDLDSSCRRRTARRAACKPLPASMAASEHSVRGTRPRGACGPVARASAAEKNSEERSVIAGRGAAARAAIAARACVGASRRA
mmetsp:Transcript_14579/g.49352  ORF Transcript_14579/g.49352 Transcript_14579/m.49352 type:complete len:283 (-) Transcript_14579:36-884(-)